MCDSAPLAGNHMFENSTDQRWGPEGAPTAEIATGRPRSLLAPDPFDDGSFDRLPMDRRPPMPARRPEPPIHPDSVLDRIEPRTVGLVLAVALGSVLLVATAFVLLRGEGTTTTSAVPESTVPLGPSSTSSDPSSASGLAPSTSGLPTTATTLAVDTSSTTATTMATTPAPPSTAAAPATSPTTVATTSTADAPTTTGAPADPSTTADPSSTNPSSTDTMATSTTVSSSSTTASTTNPGGPGPSGNDAAVQQQVLDATNAERAANGCPPLRLDPLLNQAADGHSEDMAARGYFSHSDPEGRGPGDRINAIGYPHRSWGENIAAGYGSAQAAVNGWMNSSGHRANILNCAFDEIGIGYAEAGRYWTQLFATRR